MKKLFLHVNQGPAWAKRRAAKCNGTNMALRLLKKLDRKLVPELFIEPRHNRGPGQA